MPTVRSRAVRPQQRSQTSGTAPYGHTERRRPASMPPWGRCPAAKPRVSRQATARKVSADRGLGENGEGRRATGTRCAPGVFICVRHVAPDSGNRADCDPRSIRVRGLRICGWFGPSGLVRPPSITGSCAWVRFRLRVRMTDISERACLSAPTMRNNAESATTVARSSGELDGSAGQSECRTSAVGVRAAMRPGTAATTFAKHNAPSAMRTMESAGNRGIRHGRDSVGEQCPEPSPEGDADRHTDRDPDGDRHR